MTGPTKPEVTAPRPFWRRSWRNRRCLEFDPTWIQAQVDGRAYSARALADKAGIHESTARRALAGQPLQPAVLRKLLAALRDPEVLL